MSKNDTSKQTIDFEAIDKMESFNRFAKRKNTFLFSITALFLLYYITLPILAFQPVLQQKVVGNITGVWFYSGSLFVMTVILAMLYIRMAAKFDKECAAVLDEYNKKGGK